jgi:hypothetical protein
MRTEYAAKESVLDQHVYEIRDGSKPDYLQFDEFVTLPSELPRLDGYDAVYFYILDLDREVLTMNHSIHWQLGNIPRQDDLWLRAIADSIHWDEFTVSLDVCPEEHMASLALELPERNKYIDYAFDIVSPKKTGIGEARTVFLTYVLANTLIEYKNEIIRFGREWSPDSFPFRELAFALVSIASGQAKFLSFPAQPCNPRCCSWQGCKSNHLPKSAGWLDEKWAGDCAPLLEFGSMSHRPGDPPGISPAETMYWLEGVVVSLALVVDGAAVTNAATWGIKQRRTNFQIVVLSLFEVAFAEVFFDDDRADSGEPFVEVRKAVYLSPLRSKDCVSTHPRERPELKPGEEIQRQYCELMQSNCTATAQRLQDFFPGLMRLVNFFEIAASRRAASSLRKFRLNDRMSIVAGPFVEYHKDPRLSFDFEDTQTGKIFRMIQAPRLNRTEECNWMPVIGSDRKALMLDVVVQFEPPPVASIFDEGVTKVEVGSPLVLSPPV